MKPMKHVPFSRTLQGGDRRSIGNSNRVAARILQQPERLSELIECLWSDDPVVRMRAADAAEKVSVQKPHFLRPFKNELLGLADETVQAELRWHLALMLPRLLLTPAERKRVIVRFREYLGDRSSIVKTFAIQGLADLAKGDATLETEMTELLEEVFRTGTPAMRARGRKLLKQFQAHARSATALEAQK
jgi:hypothetical protein